MKSIKATLLPSLFLAVFTFSQPLYLHSAVLIEEESLENFLDLPRQLKATERIVFQAVKDNDIETLKRLKKEEANFEITDFINRTPLHVAVESNNFDVVQFLIMEVGVDIEAREVDGWTALYCAVDEDSPEIIELLLNVGANFETRDNYGMTALHWAAKRNRPKAAKALKEAGADLNAVNIYGETALEIAREHNSKDTIKHLRPSKWYERLFSSDKLEAKNNEYGQTALDIEREDDIKDTTKPFMSYALDGMIDYFFQKN